MQRQSLSTQLVEARAEIQRLNQQIARMARYEDALRHEVSQAKADAAMYKRQAQEVAHV